MAYDLTNIDVDPALAYQQYSVVTTIAPVTNIEGGVAITTINGVTGPKLTLGGGTTGYDFAPAGNALNLVVASATTVRGSISAAKSGSNSDITDFTVLTGSGGWNAWTGSSDKTAHATYSGTASAGYVQAELQGVMDKLKETTEALKALLDTLFLSGVIKA
jgi:hypothetical protein